MADINLGNDTTINTTLNEPSGINTSVSTDIQLNASVSDINYIPGYEEAEKQRRENEIQRQENESERIAYYEDIQQKVQEGYFDGEDGYSPIANVTKENTTATITITDKIGTTTATISDGQNGVDGKDGKDGKDGIDGQDGQDGADGFSPTATVSKSGDTATISITDKNGTTTETISDGVDGTDGQDGYSPTATVTKSGKVATITITDKNGTTTTEIRDGEDGHGSGDMLKATYDTNDNGIVDNAEKVNNHTVEKDVPSNAVFTDSNAVWGNITGTLSNQSDLSTALGNKVEYSDLASVATSGDYGDLSNTPTIPTVNDATLTIKKNNTNVGTFTANASSNVDINITVPTTASDVGAVPTSSVGTASGVAELDANGKVPSSQLPSYVDDVIEGYYKVADGKFYKESTYTTEIPGETGKIYISVDTNKSYRWTGSGFAEISSSLALGETSSTAYRGDRGKTAYDHSQLTSGNPHNVSKSDVGLGNVGNFKAVSTEASQGLSSTEQANARTNIGAGTSSFSGSYNDLSNKPSIPTKTSDLTNDSGFVTSEVSVSTTQPSEDFELWINPNESVNVYGNYISNTYGTSTEIGYSQEYVNKDNIYSTNEIKTNKVWIDGKPIYRKVLTGTTGAGGSWANINVSSLNIDKVTDLKFDFGTSEHYHSNFYLTDNYQLTVRYNDTNNDKKVQYNYGSGYSNQKYVITLEYTKTTD